MYELIHTLPLSDFRQQNLNACASKNYSTVVIHLKEDIFLLILPPRVKRLATKICHFPANFFQQLNLQRNRNSSSLSSLLQVQGNIFPFTTLRILGCNVSTETRGFELGLFKDVNSYPNFCFISVFAKICLSEYNFGCVITPIRTNVINEALNCSFSGLTVEAVNWTRNGLHIKEDFNKTWSAVSVNSSSHDQVIGKFKCTAKRGDNLYSCSANPSKLKFQDKLH